MRHLLLLIAFLLPVFIYAQKGDDIETKESTPSSKKAEVLQLLTLPSNISLEDGQELDKYKKNGETKILLSDSSGFYGVSTIVVSPILLKKSAYFFHCDNKMNLIKGEELEFNAEGEKLHLHTVKVMKGVIYVLGVRSNFSEKKAKVFIQSVNKNTLKLNNDIKKIAELDYFDYNDSYQSIVYSSKDESKLLICCGKHLKITDKEPSFALLVLDNNMNQLWEKSITLPYSKNLYALQNVVIDNQGTVCFSGQLYNSKDDEIDSDGMPNYNQVISFCKGGINEIGEFILPNNGKFISNISIMPISNGEFIFTGQYKEKLSSRKTTGIKGIYFLRANIETKEVKFETYKEIEEDEVENEGVFEINIESDGSVILIGEKLFTYTSTMTTTRKMDVSTPSMSPGTAVVTTTTSRSGSSSFYARDILVAKVNSKGSFEWVASIPKHEESYERKNIASIYLIAKEKTYLVYNDNPKNLTRKDDVKHSNGAIVTLVEINNSDGTWNKYQLYSNKESDTDTCPTFSKSADNNSLLLYRDSHSKFKYTRVTFK